VPPADVEAVGQIRKWAIGLPIIPPTKEAVARMMKGTSHEPGEIVWDAMPPRNGVVTVEIVAATGVMAGAKPEHMPVLLAIVEAMKANVASAAPEFTDLAIRIANGSSGFFRNDVAKWGRESAGSDAVLLSQFEEVNEHAAVALEEAATWLKNDLAAHPARNPGIRGVNASI
jgi:hypothetical protein